MELQIMDADARIAEDGVAVVLLPDGGEESGAEALMRDFGFGEPPSSWGEAFKGQARHVEFRFSRSLAELDPRTYVTHEGERFELLRCEPEAGFWVCRCAGDRRGGRWP